MPILGKHKHISTDILGTIESQPSPHTHPESDVTGLTTDLSGKANSSHMHQPSEVTGTAVVTNDSRLSDARTPTTHDSTKHSVAYAAASDLTTHTGLSTTAHGGIVASNDARLSDARTPLSHSHSESDVTNLTTDLGNKQSTLVSGTNIKTINGSSLLAEGDMVVGGGPSGGNFGLATIPFASWLNEDSVSVTGQAGISGTSKILASLYADNDDVYAQDWRPPIIRNVVAGVGFDICLRPEIGSFKGNMKINWSWGD